MFSDFLHAICSYQYILSEGWSTYKILVHFVDAGGDFRGLKLFANENFVIMERLTMNLRETRIGFVGKYWKITIVYKFQLNLNLSSTLKPNWIDCVFLGRSLTDFYS